MGVEVVDSDLAQLSIDKVTEVDKSFLHENGKLDKDPVYNNPIEVDSHSEEPDKEKRMAERSDMLSQVRALNVDFEQFKTILDEKKMEIEPLQQALGKLRKIKMLIIDLVYVHLRKSSILFHFNGIYELQIHSLQYRIQHEGISLSEEKRILKEIKHLEGTREKVIANAAMRSKIQDSLGQKEDIQDQVKLMGVDLNGVRKEQHAVWSKKKQIKDKLDETETKIVSLQNELKAVTLKRDKAFENIQELRKQSDQGNSHFYQSRTIVHNAKLLAAQKDIKALEELSIVEVEKFMALWKAIKPSGMIMRKELCHLWTKPVDSETETILRPSVRKPKEEAKSGPQTDTKPAKKAPKDAETIAMESNPLSDISVVAEEILVSGKLQKNKEVDAAKLKELKREEEIAKAKQAMERKKKLAEKAAAKAARRAQMEAEKKLKEIICFLIWLHFIAKKKVAGSTNAVNPEELIEAVAQDSEPEKVDVNTDAPVPATISMKGKVPKEKTSRYRNQTKRTESLPKAILKRKKSMNYWIWAAPDVVVVLVLLALCYYYLA
ncbi:hypothetical protein ES288_D05G417100v1 [Gossypium darwinii]|uniref:Proton pump-interactor 1 n=1 Tax=Gossypium darwinii TaxID=34276 RepID=A0A5D2CTW5_GOSDA|nr:hypothetical protein ES288_D05G417100v1 [Gossypium darwinii]